MIAIPYSAAVELPDGIWGQDATVEDPTIYGDLNGNGKVDAVDYAKVKRAVIGTYKLTEEEAFLADVDHDGQIKAKDYAMIKRIVLKTYTPDPIYFVISARMELHADGTGRYSVAFGDVLSMDVELEFVSYDAETGVYTYSLILEGEVVGEGEISVNEDGSLTLYDEAGDTILPVYDPDEEPKPVPVTEPVPSVG